MNSKKAAKGIPIASKIPKSGPDSGTHSRSSSVSNLTTASDIHSEAGDAMSENNHDFKVDDRVWVNGSKPGYIKFLGSTQFAPGVWAGIVLDEPVGKNDGSVAGIKYFSCEPLKGIFARPQKLTRSLGAMPSTGDNINSTTPRPSGATTPLSRGLATSTASLSSARGACSRLRLGERVAVSSTAGMKYGILRYLGEADFAKGEWAGIELDEPVGKNDGSVAGKRYFACKMKYGLFSPLHKVSRAGGTSTPRTTSVRGTPLMRSTSRDSLSSSVSNSSKASKTSRVKLGITSLTNSQQKGRTTGGIGIMTTSRALEEALKEKEQHIEQLLKEHDLERSEVARVTSRCEELETKCVELLKQQQGIVIGRKDLEEQLSVDKRKLEDLQFQLEEERVITSDLEMQLQQHNQVLKRLGDFLNENLDTKFINIREILDGKENLSETSEEKENYPQLEIFKEKIGVLETSLASSISEKEQNVKDLEDTKALLSDSEIKNKNLLMSLNTTIQEKDDVISNLRNELSAQLEKLTKIMEDNKSLNELINLQANEAKGHTDEIVQELGEKIKSLTEELNSKCNLIQEHEISIQEKDSKISSLDKSMETQTQLFADIQNQNQTLQQELEKKKCELTDITAMQKCLEDEIVTLKSQVGIEVSEKEEKIKSLTEELNSKCNLIQEHEVSIQEKDSKISSLDKSIETQTQQCAGMQNQNKTLQQELEKKKSELTDITAMQKCLEDEVVTLKSQVGIEVSEKEEKIKSLTEELNSKCNLIQEHEISIQEKDSKISSLDKSMETQAQQCADMQNQNQTLQQELEQKKSELTDITTIQKCLENEIVTLKSQVGVEVSEKEEKILGLVKELESVTSSLQEKDDAVTQKQTEVSTLCQKIEELTKTNSQMIIKMRETEENMSGQSKDNHIKISSLQEEINRLKEEKDDITCKLGKELETMQTNLSVLSQELDTSKTALSEQESQMSVLTKTLNEKQSEFVEVDKELSEVKQSCVVLCEEKKKLIDSLKTKEELYSELEKQLGDLQKLKEQSNKDISDKQNKLVSLQNVLKQTDEENIQLTSKLQLAEQNVEMLNKDSSEHVMSLQSELSKLKEESTKTKASLEEKIVELQKEKEKACIDISVRSKSLTEKEEALSVLQQQVNIKENDLSNLSSQVEKLEKDISALIKSKEEAQTLLEKQLLTSKEEFDTELKMKDMKLAGMQEECDKLSKAVNEGNSTLDEKEEVLLKLQEQLKEKESTVSDLSSITAKLKEELNVIAKDKDNVLTMHEKKIQVTREEFDSELKKKDLIIEERQAKISACNEVLESHSKELLEKEKDILSLKNALKEKESQFDELSQMIEFSQAQLKKLSEQNENNEKLLQSKEAFINDYQAEKEKQIIELKEVLITENSKLQELLRNQENDVKQKSEIILKLNAEAEEQAKQIEILNNELAKSKKLNENTLQNNNEMHKDLTDKIDDLEAKYSKLIEEKKKIEAEEQNAKGEKKNLEEVRDSLMKEKVQREEIVKDRETKLETLQVEVNRMQAEFSLHKQELQQKLDVSEMELQAAVELKKQLELQHSVLEELQQELQDSEEKRDALENQLNNMSALSSEKTGLMNKLSEFEKADKEKFEKLIEMDKKYHTLEELYKNNENSLLAKEKECVSLSEKLNVLYKDQKSNDVLKSLEQENILLKFRIEQLENSGAERNENESGLNTTSQVDTEEQDSLLSQIDFLNSIIVDMKQKNEKLQQEMEILMLGPGEIDANLNDVPKKLAPRLFCDICDMFDLHDTDDCPKQASFIEDEGTPQMLPHSARELEERPYCNTCEVFGHWTLDCEAEETY